MKIYTDKQQIRLEFGRKQFYLFMTIEVICWLIALGLIGWGVFQYRETERLQQENLLHQRQLEIANQKLTTMEQRMQRLDALDAEIRQMIQGGQTGAVPAGDGATLAQKPLPAAPRNPGELLSRLAKWEDHATQRLISLSTLQLAIRDGIDLNSFVPVCAPPCNGDSETPDMWPAIGTLSDYFGWRADPYTGAAKFHEGIDIANSYGTPIEVTAKGKVTRSEWVPGYGNLVEVEHAGGIVTRYGHNSLNVVKAGDLVHAGQVVAFMGSTGKSTGSHVHYEVRVNGTPVDPMIFLPKEMPKPSTFSAIH